MSLLHGAPGVPQLGTLQIPRASQTVSQHSASLEHRKSSGVHDDPKPQ
jgi:hypothetical protein